VRLTFAFHGVLVDGGTVDGTVTYAKDSPVVGTNVRGLAPNVTYALVGWNLTVHQTTFVLPNVVFTSALPGQAEFCIGECIFSPLRMQRLLFRSGTSSLALMFLLPEGMSEALPSTLTDWAPFAVNLSEFRMLLDAETVWPLTSGTLTVVE
jgi:hypothetical protein